MADDREAQSESKPRRRKERRRPFYQAPDWTWPQFDPASCQQCARVIPMHETGWILQEFILCESCFAVLDDERERRGSVTIAPGVVFEKEVDAVESPVEAALVVSTLAEPAPAASASVGDEVIEATHLGDEMQTAANAAPKAAERAVAPIVISLPVLDLPVATIVETAVTAAIPAPPPPPPAPEPEWLEPEWIIEETAPAAPAPPPIAEVEIHAEPQSPGTPVPGSPAQESPTEIAPAQVTDAPPETLSPVTTEPAATATLIHLPILEIEIATAAQVAPEPPVSAVETPPVPIEAAPAASVSEFVAVNALAPVEPVVDEAPAVQAIVHEAIIASPDIETTAVLPEPVATERDASLPVPPVPPPPVPTTFPALADVAPAIAEAPAIQSESADDSPTTLSYVPQSIFDVLETALGSPATIGNTSIAVAASLPEQAIAVSDDQAPQESSIARVTLDEPPADDATLPPTDTPMARGLAIGLGPEEALCESVAEPIAAAPQAATILETIEPPAESEAAIASVDEPSPAPFEEQPTSLVIEPALPPAPDAEQVSVVPLVEEVISEPEPHTAPVPFVETPQIAPPLSDVVLAESSAPVESQTVEAEAPAIAAVEHATEGNTPPVPPAAPPAAQAPVPLSIVPPPDAAPASSASDQSQDHDAEPARRRRARRRRHPVDAWLESLASRQPEELGEAGDQQDLVYRAMKRSAPPPGIDPAEHAKLLELAIYLRDRWLKNVESRRAHRAIRA